MKTQRQQTAPGERSVSCFVGEIPDWIEGELARRYSVLHSSLPFFRVFRSVRNVNAYVAMRDGVAAEILLFVADGRRIEVLNEMIAIEPEGVRRFAEHVFEGFPQADLIRFNAVDMPAAHPGYPLQRYHAKSTFAIELPATPEEYLAGIGKSTRASIRQQMNYARKHIPSFAVRFYYREEVDERDIREIIRFSEQRIESQGTPMRYDVERIIALVKACGFVAVLSVDGRVRAGSINYCVGTGYFGEVIGFDPECQRYGFGKLCTVEAISEAIRNGARTFYLGGGDFSFKERMLGKKVCMDQLQLYRSRARLLANLDQAALFFAQGNLRRLKNFLHRHRDALIGRIVFKFFHAYKNKMSK